MTDYSYVWRKIKQKILFLLIVGLKIFVKLLPQNDRTSLDKIPKFDLMVMVGRQNKIERQGWECVMENRQERVGLNSNNWRSPQHHHYFTQVDGCGSKR